MPEKKKKSGSPHIRTLGVHVRHGSMGTNPLTGDEKGTVTHFSYFTSQETGIDVKLIQLHPLPPSLTELAKKKIEETGESAENFEEFFDTISWNFSVSAYFGRNERNRLILRTFVIPTKEEANAFVKTTLDFLRGPDTDAVRVLLKHAGDDGEDEEEETGGPYTSVLEAKFVPNENEDGTRAMELSYSLVDDNGHTEFYSTTMACFKLQEMMEKLDARLNPGG